MYLPEEILKEHSKKQCEKIVRWVGHSRDRFNELFNIFIQPESKSTQRAAWPLSYCVEANPEFLNAHFNKLIAKMQTPVLHDAIKRNAVRALQFASIPEKYQGEIMDICFRYLESPKESVAVKVNSLHVLVNMSKQYPEILSEINIVIEEQLPYQSAGFKSAARKVLKTSI